MNCQGGQAYPSMSFTPIKNESKRHDKALMACPSQSAVCCLHAQMSGIRKTCERCERCERCYESTKMLNPA